jgi:hypothetical protein
MEFIIRFRIVIIVHVFQSEVIAVAKYFHQIINYSYYFWEVENLSNFTYLLLLSPLHYSRLLTLVVCSSVFMIQIK